MGGAAAAAAADAAAAGCPAGGDGDAAATTEAAATRAGCTGPAPAAAGRRRSRRVLACFRWYYIVVAVEGCSTTSLRCFACDVLGDPFFPKPLKLSPCFWKAMLIPDGLASSVPHVIIDVVVLPNTCCLPGTAESVLIGSIHNTSSIRSGMPLPKTGTEDVPPPPPAGL